MGVTGLWRLIEPAGKPVPVESLENKVLAIDISIWLHQMVKGYQDAKGAPLPNAHLMGLFQRLCKLLYFRIKPVFVFDGAFPDLKKETIAKRQDSKNKNNSESERLKRQLALILGKKTAVSGLLGKQISPKKLSSNNTQNNDDIFKLPALPEKIESESESEDEDESSGSTVDLHSVDIESDDFKKMPIKEKYDLLLELKDTRKMNSWGKLHTLPKKSENFSEFQMARLLKRKKLQECLHETEKVMGDVGMSLIDLESLLNEEGIETKIDSIPTRRIASNNDTRFLLINNVKQAIEEAKQKEETEVQQAKNGEEKTKENPTPSRNTELEDDLEKAIKMSLECHDVDTSVGTSKTDDSGTSFMTDSEYSDSEEDDGFEQPNMSSAKAYIMQYSDLTHKAINSIVVRNKKNYKEKSKVPTVSEIIEDLNNDKLIIGDKVELSSSDDDFEENTGIENVQSQSISDINPNPIIEFQPTSNIIDTTQQTVVCIKTAEPDIVTFDTSSEDETTKLEPKLDILTKFSKVDEEESSSDDDFEEVPDAESGSDITSLNPVVQVTIKFDEKQPEDNLFADIFSCNTKSAQMQTEMTALQYDSSDIYKNPIASTSGLSKHMFKKETEPISETVKLDHKTETLIETPSSNPRTNDISVKNVDVSKETLPSNITETGKLLKNEDKLPKKYESLKVIPKRVLEPDKSKEITMENTKENPRKSKNTELEDDLEKAIKMSLECNDVDTSVGTSKTDDSGTSFMTGSEYSEEDDGFDQPNMSSAKAYIMQYSDLTHKAINSIVVRNKKNYKEKSKVPTVGEIIKDLNNDKLLIGDKVDLSSSDDDLEENTGIENVQSQSISDINPNPIIEFQPTSNIIDTTQQTVVCIKTPEPDIVTFDTSSEYETTKLEPKLDIITKFSRVDEEESSSDDDFEEVPDAETGSDITSLNPVVQVTINFDEKLPEDDLFADIFLCNTKSAQMQTEITALQYDSSDIYKNPIASTSGLSKHMFKKETEPISEKVKLDHKTETIIETPSSNPRTNDISVKKFDVSKETLPSNITETGKLLKNEDKLPKKYESLKVIPKRVLEPDKSKEITMEKLNTMAEELENQEAMLLNEKHRLERFGRNITEQMTKEAQELLQLFGIPYIVAPMEAEAQCAFLESAKLTDGTITDDSDIWLFGGRTVYKNFFNQKKHVLQFLADRIEKSFNLTREQLILLALLVGSDYTTGVTGVGPVTAMEILASFPFSKKQLHNETSTQGKYSQIITGLQEFKKWVRAGKRTDNTTLKKKLKNVALTDDFPSIRVVQAYMEPNVQKSEENFTWGEIDVTMLRDYTREKFGWSQHKVDEIIKPVLGRILDRKSQRNIQDYFKKKIEFQSLDEHMSKRVKAAVQRMGPDGEVIAEDQSKPAEKKTNGLKKRKYKETNTCDKNNLSKDHSNAKQNKSNEDNVIKSHCIRVVSEVEDGKSTIEIKIHKTDRVQEIIPQREKEKKSLLENKLKAIEIFRKSKIDRKTKHFKKRVNKPKEKADLSESSSSE